MAVDLRPESATFGKSYGVELNDLSGKLLWIPAGFGHGFTVLGDESADVLYKTTAEYNPSAEDGIRWDDPDLAIKWPVDVPAVSERDHGLQSFADYRLNPPRWG